MIVAKFGGKSVSSSTNIETIARIAKQELKKQPVIVVSALSQVTNMLIALSEANPDSFDQLFERIRAVHFNLMSQLWGEKIPEEVKQYINERLDHIKTLAKKENKTKAQMDRLLMHGEIMSSYIIASALSIWGIKAQQVLATDLIVTNSEFGSAEFIPQLTVNKIKKIIEPFLKKRIVPVITGFIGATEIGEPTTIGRGGSDYSASIIGYALNAEEIQIWSDVDGIFSADPRVIPNAKHLKKISFQEAAELAYFGAKILHPRTMHPAITAGIPLRVMNTMNPKSSGTIISKDPESMHEIKAITSKKEITLINIHSTSMLFSKGFLAKVYSIFAKYSISVSMVSSSVISDSIILDNDDNLKEALVELSEFTSVAKISDFGIVSLVGEGIVGIPHVMKKVFSILDEQKIAVKMISLGATDINISLVMPSSRIEEAVKVLHDGLIN